MIEKIARSTVNECTKEQIDSMIILGWIAEPLLTEINKLLSCRK